MGRAPRNRVGPVPPVASPALCTVAVTGCVRILLLCVLGLVLVVMLLALWEVVGGVTCPGHRVGLRRGVGEQATRSRTQRLQGTQDRGEVSGARDDRG